MLGVLATLFVRAQTGPPTLEVRTHLPECSSSHFDPDRLKAGLQTPQRRVPYRSESRL